MASLFDAVERPRVIINTNDFNKPKSLADAIEKPIAEVPSEGVPEHHTSRLQSVMDKLFGLHGQERYQLWPERLVRDAISAPHNVMTEGLLPPGLRREDFTDIPASTEPTTAVGKALGLAPTAWQPNDNAIEKAQAVSALAGTGGLAGAGNEAGVALGSGPLKNDLIAAAKNHFGLTSNPKEAGYVMPDGSMLDFSGRHYADYVKQGDRFVPQKGTDYLRDQRNVDHRELHDIMETPVNEMTGRLDNNLMLSKFMNDAGAIRNQPGVGFETSVIPTNKQLKALVAGHNSSYRGQPLKVDLSSPSGEVYASFDFNRPNIEGVKNWISSNFKELKSDNEAGLGIGVLAQTNKPFYSAVENAVAAAKQPKADVQQWLSFLKNQPGVKQEELAHLGLDKLSGSITKDELLKAVQEGQPQIKEVIKGTEKGPFGNAAYDAANSYRQDLVNKYGNGIRNKASKEELDRLDDLEARGEMKNPNPTKYHSYQLPGGENYREMLLTLPDKQQRLYEWEYFDPKTQTSKQFKTEAEAKAAAPEGAVVNQKEVAELNPAYRSSHWDEPNVLAHIRMNDRTVDGKKSLHLEEIQSDWHQAGRKQGYKSEEAVNKYEDLLNQKAKAADILNKIQKEIRNKVAEGYDTRNLTAEQKSMLTKKYTDTRAANQDWVNARNEFDKIQSEIEKGNPYMGVPDAPFKKTWDELALKKAITHAVKNGYDSISWTPGEAQAARYDLSKQVNLVSANKQPNGKYLTYIEGKDEGPLFRNRDGFSDNGQKEMTAQELEATIGKEAAEKIINGKPNKEGWIDLRDKDLKVGGQGMKAFYDKMLVDKANAIGKKFGAKVSKKGINTTDAPDGEFLKYPENHPYRIKNYPEVFTMQLTPELKDHVLKKGFPLFSAGVPVFNPVDHNPFEEKK